jgi:hypothetical protein
MLDGDREASPLAAIVNVDEPVLVTDPLVLDAQTA